jgi:hypothetical protein
MSLDERYRIGDMEIPEPIVDWIGDGAELGDARHTGEIESPGAFNAGESKVGRAVLVLGQLTKVIAAIAESEVVDGLDAEIVSMSYREVLRASFFD